MKRMFFCLCLAGWIGPAWAADTKPALKLEELFPDKALARGKGFEIKSSAIEQEFTAFKTSMAAQGRSVPEDQRADFEAKILERLIISKILDIKATADDRSKARESVDKYLAEVKKRTASDDSYNRQIEATGLTQAQFRQRILERATIEEVFIREVKSKIAVTDEQAKKFYDGNPARFTQPETVRVRHILRLTVDPKLVGVSGVSPEHPAEKRAAQREEIEKLLKRARAGEDFAKLAGEFSEDPGSKENGGEITFARSQMSPEFEAAAFSLAVNQISDIVTSKYGYHIVKMLEKTPAKQVPFDETKTKLKDYLIQQEADKQLPGYVEQLKKEAGVEILDPRYKK